MEQVMRLDIQQQIIQICQVYIEQTQHKLPELQQYQLQMQQMIQQVPQPIVAALQQQIQPIVQLLQQLMEGFQQQSQDAQLLIQDVKQKDVDFDAVNMRIEHLNEIQNDLSMLLQPVLVDIQQLQNWVIQAVVAAQMQAFQQQIAQQLPEQIQQMQPPQPEPQKQPMLSAMPGPQLQKTGPESPKN
jgi:hypothetical protein